MKPSRLSPWFWAFLSFAALRFLAVVPFIIDDDEAFWAVSARALKLPWLFYRQSPDDKPPGAVWFCWILEKFFGHLGSDPRFIRGVFVLLTLLTALLVGSIARRLQSARAEREAESRRFWGAALLFLLISTLPSPKLLAFTGDGLMTTFVVAAYAMLLRKRAKAELVLSGILLAFALLVKQTAIFAFFPILFARRPVHWAFKDRILVILGSLLILIPSVAALGASEMMYWVWTYPKDVLIYARAESFSGFQDLGFNTLIFCGALLPVFVLLFKTRLDLRRTRFEFASQWLLSSICVVLIGKGLFLHYYLMIAPPLAILLSESLLKIDFRLWQKLWLSAGYAVCCLLVTFPALEVAWGTDLPYFSSLAAKVQPVLHAEDKVLLWGGSSVLLAYTDAKPVTRFVLPRYAVKPYGTTETRDIFLQEIKQSPPSVVIDLHERGDNRFGNSIESDPDVNAMMAGYHLYVIPEIPWAKLYFRSPLAATRHLVEITTPTMRAQVYQTFPKRDPAWTEFQSLLHAPLSFGLIRRALEMDRRLREEHAQELMLLQGVVEPAARFMPLELPEWWFTVSLKQMQPRAKLD